MKSKTTKQTSTNPPTVHVPCVEDRLLAARNQLVMLMAAGAMPSTDSIIVDSETFLEAIMTTARDAYENVLSVSQALDVRAHNIKAPTAALYQTIGDQL